jgi:beta-N-acetylhexosaminidase
MPQMLMRSLSRRPQQKRGLIGRAAVVVTLGAAACAGHQPIPRTPSVTPRATAMRTRWADSVLATLTLRQKAAQMVWPNLMGDYGATDAPAWRRLVHAVADAGVGGLLMSVGSPDEIALKLNALQRLAPLPLLVSSDLEYGAGMRARGGYFVPNAIDLGGATVFPPQMALGATDDTTLAYEEGRITAVEGRALGIHLDFAPVLDVNNNANNPVINTRSYGEDPQRVAAFGRSFIRGVQDHGMVATGKHFPGHGDTDVNSHLGLPVVNATRARLDSVEFVPFEGAIGTGVGAIMSFHGSMPALDPSGAPATESPLVLTGLLRQQLHFSGLVVSDAMDMRALVDHYGAGEAVKGAVAAGVDVLIQVMDVDQAIDAIVAGVTEGRYPESRIDSSVKRILDLKEAMRLDRHRLVDVDSIRTIVGDSANKAFAQIVADRSITLVKDSLGTVPLNRLPRESRILSVTIAHRPDLAAGVAFAGELRRAFPDTRTEFIDADDPGDKPLRVLAESDSAAVTIVGEYIGQSDHATTVNAPQVIASFVDQLSAHRSHPVVIAFGNPYFLSQVPSTPAYLVAWGPLPVSQIAAAHALLGVTPIVGRLPISIPPYGAGAGASAPERVEPQKVESGRQRN